MDESNLPERILIVRPSALGDVCRTVPVLASLRATYPGARIDWLVRDTYAAAIASHPALTEAIPFPRARFACWWRSVSVARELMTWLRELRARRYDLVFDCQGLGRSGFFARVTGAPRRVGFRGARELAWLGYNVRHPRPDMTHTVDAMLSLIVSEGVEPVLDMSLAVAPDDRRWWEALRPERADRRAEFGTYAVLAPTARWESKRWPIDRWRELIGPLLEMGLDRVVIIGAPDESEQVQGLTTGPADGNPRIVDLVGRTTIGQTMAVIADASLVIANDSAPLHMAVGFDRPCVALFGPTDPNIVGPYGRPECVLRVERGEETRSTNYRDRRLGDSLMRGITLLMVVERAGQLLGRSAAARAAADSTRPPAAVVDGGEA